MTLNANALISVNDLTTYLRTGLQPVELFSIYHDQSASASAATVQVTATQLLLVITGGTNAGTTTYTLATQTDIATLVAAINALAKGWMAVAVGSTAASATTLSVFPSTSTYGVGATQYLSGPDTASLEAAINDASQAIETWCGRSLKSATYNHLYCGSGQRELVLRQYPIVSVARVAIGRQLAGYISNSSTDCIDATATLDDSNLTLIVAGGANAGTSTIAYTGSTTLTTLAAAVIALGKGWSMTIDPQASGTWLVDDLFKFSGRTCLMPGMDIYAPAQGITRYEVNVNSGILTRTGGAWLSSNPAYPNYPIADAWPLELPPITAENSGPRFTDGMFNVFVRYVAGYATIPADIQNVCKELAANIYHRGARDTSLQGESVEGYTWSARPQADPFDVIKSRLAPYKMYRAPAFAEA